MSPYPMDPIDATGPLRLVVTAMPEGPGVDALVRGVLERRLAVCAQVLAARSTYWWKGAVESAEERVIWFKTAPKLVGALFRFLAQEHPYEVPEIVEIDAARVHPPYLEYVAATVDADAPPLPLGGGHPRRRIRSRPGARRARGAPRPARTRAPRRRP